MRFKEYITEEQKNNTLITRLQECLHCVGFSIYQQNGGKLTKELFDDSDVFTKAYNDIDVDSSENELIIFKDENPSWVDSIITTVHAVEKSGWLKGKSYKFSRTNGMMDVVYSEFNKIKKQNKIKLNDDKWNPSDIWASKITGLPKTFDDLMEYNKFISDNLKKGDLVGISLKKVGSSAKVIFQGSSVKPKILKFGLIKKGKKVFPTGVTITTSDGDVKFNARSFRISKCQDIVVELTLSSTARGGKVPSEIYKQMVKKYHIPQMSDKRIKQYMNEGEDKLKEIILSLWKQSNIDYSENIVERGWKKDQPQNYLDDHCFWKSIIHSLELAAFLSENKSIANDMVMEFYINGKSMSELSSDFIVSY